MRLERLEINGFKSFSDRAELAFDKGVTAIVGPNGCGKSNVADAITWVMGEQSAKSLRGERMEDVIFSGSDARKPTAAAEVRLRFSGVVNGQGSGNGHHAVGNGHGNGHANGNGHVNGNGHDSGRHEAVPSGVDEILESVAREVEVTRRLFRSGESEYLIDGRVCRLRDVHDLLMDTGLGAKAYAIIEQGKIGLILSSRPTDRRQLIEEAAGITKYKARRRSAELKLEAAQQNLTRIDDIVFEVEKQRGTLKRQAAKARRHRTLRDELRRWEKVLFARRYRQLAETIEAGRARLAEAREREAVASARVAEGESDLSRTRLQLVEAEARATEARESAHAREMAISRRQQQLGFERDQIETLSQRVAIMAAELLSLDGRREPARAAVESRRTAAAAAATERDAAQQALAAESTALEAAQREIEGLEADVEAARSEVFSAINAATALRHSLSHSATERERVVEQLSRYGVEISDVRVQANRAQADRDAAAALVKETQALLEASRAARAVREAELATASIEHEWRAREVRSREQDLAGLMARLASLEELEAARVQYGEAARTVLAQANGRVNQRGPVADYLEVEPGYERAVDACLGDLLQYVIVEQPDFAAAGLDLVREAKAGRCGFLIATPGGADLPPRAIGGDGGVVALSSVTRVSGPYATAIRQAMGQAWIVETYADAARLSVTADGVVATRAGDLFRGPHLVTGGSPEEARGILETRGAIKDLRRRIDDEQAALARLGDEATELASAMARASSAIAALQVELHGHEKAMVGHEAQLSRALEDLDRLARKADQLARERGQAEEERDLIDRRQQEAHESVARLEGEQRGAEDRLTSVQRRLFEAREAAQDLGRRAADLGAAHAALVERASALAADVARLEEAAVELEDRIGALAADRVDTDRRVFELRASVAAGTAALDADIYALDGLRAVVRDADDAAAAFRARTETMDQDMKEARGALEDVRARVAELDIARATAETDLSHLAQNCVDAVQATLDEVLAEVTAQEAEGGLTPDARVICADEPDEDREGDAEAVEATVESAETIAAQQTLSAEEAISRLRAKIERLGPVNMMAIDQFEELETRHVFLTTQRKDLVDSIAQTSEAIKRIDETTRSRFAEAFTAINQNFQLTFSTLFGGGRAGLTLIDENDPLESGIEIIAQPPGKRLQSVQLLSGGEKALTAIALMFALFKYKPSPFCLLDEIDAPLDDANIGRFVEMLRGMQQHTQFILITHNRKTMEIADRLYGVTMEEPGVSKLISVQMN
jgi:chromosome segregation protein